MKISIHHLLVVTIAIIIGIFFFIQPALIEKSTTLEEIRLGTLPDQSAKNLETRLQPLLDYLSLKTGIHCKVIIPSGYSELVKLFAEHKVDIAYFGGLTFLQAHKNHGAEALVMREIDTRFTSLFITNKKNSTKKLTDFKDKVISFGNRLSTSGHLMPRHFLHTEYHIKAENYFAEVRYSGTHDKTIYQVRDNKVDLGAVNAAIYRKMIADGRINHNDIQIIWKTPPYADYVWAVNSHLNNDIKTQLRNAFLSLDITDPGHQTILQNLSARAFLPAGYNDFQMLHDVANKFDLLDITDK